MSSNYSLVVIVHTVAVFIAFLISFFIFQKPKGTKLYKIMGRIFVLSMLIGLISSFFIRTNGQFSFIHILSILSLYWIFKAFIVLKLKPNNWQYLHIKNMTSAYASIIIAGSGVISRHFIFRGNSNYGFIISAITAIPVIYIIRNKIHKYNPRNNNFHNIMSAIRKNINIK